MPDPLFDVAGLPCGEADFDVYGVFERDAECLLDGVFDVQIIGWLKGLGCDFEVLNALCCEGEQVAVIWIATEEIISVVIIQEFQRCDGIGFDLSGCDGAIGDGADFAFFDCAMSGFEYLGRYQLFLPAVMGIISLRPLVLKMLASALEALS